MTESKRRWAVILIGLGLSVLAALCVARWLLGTPSPDAELARTTREAVEAALEAEETARHVIMGAGVLRLTVAVAAVLAPLLVAYLVLRLGMAPEPGADELTKAVADAGLLPPPAAPRQIAEGHRALPLKDQAELLRTNQDDPETGLD